MVGRTIIIFAASFIAMLASVGHAEMSIAEKARARAYEGGVDEQPLQVQNSTYFDQERRFRQIEMGRRPASLDEVRKELADTEGNDSN